MPRGRKTPEVGPVAEQKPVVEQKPKGPRGLRVQVQVTAPWGEHTLSFSMKNALGNVPRLKQNEKAFQRAILKGLREEFGGSFE